MDSYLKDTNDNQEEGQIGKRDLASLKHGEDIIEAVVEANKMREEYQEYENDLASWKTSGEIGQKPQKPDMLRLGNAKSIPEYVFGVIATNKTSNLEGNLRFLHFSHAEQLLVYIRYCLVNNLHFELSIRVLLFILDSYHQPLASSKKFTQLLDQIRQLVNSRLQRQIDSFGLSIAGLKLMKKELGFLKEEKVALDTLK